MIQSQNIEVNNPEWVEIRCNHCVKHEGGAPRLLLRFRIEPLDDKDIQPRRKVGIESKCKDCKNLTYRTLIV